MLLPMRKKFSLATGGRFTLTPSLGGDSLRISR